MMEYVSGETPKCSAHVASWFPDCAAAARNAVLQMFHPYAVNIPSHCNLIWSLCACQDQRGDLLVLNFQFFTRNGRLFHASCCTGARLFLSPGASLAPHPLCKVSVCCAHAFTPAWTPTNSSLPLPGRLTGTLRDHPVWYQGKAPNLQPVAKSLYTFLVHFAFSTFVRPFSTGLPFLSVFQKGLGLCNDVCV